MAGRFRNFWLVGAFLLVILAVGLVLQSALWACAAAALLGIVGVVALRGNRWRSAALLATALALSLVALDLFAGLLSPKAMNMGVVTRTIPQWWPPPDPILGFRPKPDSEVIATATWGSELVYRQTYHFDSAAARVTPPAPDASETYLFIGDSFIFGQGLRDDETMPSQFTKQNVPVARSVNLGVPGYGPNHLVRAFEAGLLDRYTERKVKAVVTWIIPAHLQRVTGDGSWLGSSPRYVLENGVLRYTGSFNEHRWRDPIAGLRYLLGQQFAFIDAIGQRQRQEEQIELFLALMAKLQADAREKFGAPLVIIYSWPDEQTRHRYGDSKVEQPLLVETLVRLRKLGAPMFSESSATYGQDVRNLMIPHDGHPSAFTSELIAAALKKLLQGP
ncbi:hypothetical protein [Reyranella sp.]|uniref:hypothetical protein n=1 Tax=Reyranella sp. TaxID=1929291 RepID=UPI003BA914F6